MENEPEGLAVMVSDSMSMHVLLRRTPRGLHMKRMGAFVGVSEKEIVEVKDPEVIAERAEDGPNKASGVSFFHCFYLGFRHMEGMFDRVSSYSIGPGLDADDSTMEVTFYFSDEQLSVQ